MDENEQLGKSPSVWQQPTETTGIVRVIMSSIAVGGRPAELPAFHFCPRTGFAPDLGKVIENLILTIGTSDPYRSVNRKTLGSADTLPPNSVPLALLEREQDIPRTAPMAHQSANHV